MCWRTRPSFFDFNATDPDGDDLTYSILHGEDAHLLELIPEHRTAVLRFLPDFESPNDNNSDNRYEATVQVSDGNASALLNLVVQVIDEVRKSMTQNQPTRNIQVVRIRNPIADRIYQPGNHIRSRSNRVKRRSFLRRGRAGSGIWVFAFPKFKNRSGSSTIL